MLFIAGLCLLASTQGQVPDPYCKDRLPNCQVYGPDACKGIYIQWATENCNNTCKICTGLPVPCEDKDTTCDLYDRSTCDNPNYAHWAQTNCRYHCRKCTPVELAAKDALTTTLPPELCNDKLDCRQYGKGACVGTYEHWAKINCVQFCGFCPGLPTPPRACADSIPSCISYDKSVCTDSKYTIWVQDNCPAYCGICHSSGGPNTPSVPGTHGPPGHITSGPVLLTPPPLPGK